MWQRSIFVMLLPASNRRHSLARQNFNQRLTSAWFGESARIKSRAFNVAVDKMAVWN